MATNYGAFGEESDQLRHSGEDSQPGSQPGYDDTQSSYTRANPYEEQLEGVPDIRITMPYGAVERSASQRSTGSFRCHPQHYHDRHYVSKDEFCCLVLLMMFVPICGLLIAFCYWSRLNNRQRSLVIGFALLWGIYSILMAGLLYRIE
eukprot:gb/GEZN01019976.1/.p1 GENE.gb/GEZN01019976.1/~~gb/GEZN01019976.1/.p1  ORF type:complete len:148 (+),score=2.14 gb/GEZN01019976.1/:117-560(+)